MHTAQCTSRYLQGIYAYVTLDEGVETSEELRKELINAVRNEIGAFGQYRAVPALTSDVVPRRL